MNKQELALQLMRGDAASLLRPKHKPNTDATCCRLHRLLAIVDARDALIADLIDLADEHVPANCGLEQLKARAAQ